jgi:tetratricopeptide (TPR) repeat protein
LARDWDALQFRTDSRANEGVRELAANSQDAGLYFADAERVLAAASTNEHQIPGNRLFHEHVHFNFDGDYLMALTLLPEVVSALGLGFHVGATNPPPRPISSREECAAALGFSSWDEIGTKAAMVRLTANPPFLDQLEHGERQARAEGEIADRTRAFQDPGLQQQAIEVYRAALARRPGDWQIHLAFGNLLIDFGRFAEAVNQFAVVVQAQPEFLPARMLCGHALRQSGRPAEAVAQFQEVLRRDPNNPGVKAAIAETLRSARAR